MNKSELKQVQILASFYKLGMIDTVARSLSSLIRAARTNKSREALMRYADMFGVRSNPEFII